MNDRDPIGISESLDGVVQALRGGADRAEVGGVFGRWDEAVGSAVAAHVRPVRLEHGALLVEVEDPAWATQVRLLSDDLKRRLHDVAGVSIERVEVRVRASGRRPG